jgi:asparagine synthase (glutamine-hydrolysing)
MIAIDLPERRRASLWVAVLDEAGPADRDERTAVLRVGGRALRVSGDSVGAGVAFAAEGSCAVVFRGFLYDRDRLAGDAPIDDEARLLLALYRRRGESFVGSLRGIFMLLLWDASKDLLLLVRDPMGLHPLFYADAARAMVVSDSIDAVLSVAGVSRQPSRAALAMHIASLPIRRERTFFEAVRRVVPGHMLRCTNGTRETSRYWDPAPVDQPVDWVEDHEAGRFMELFDRAVERCQTRGRAGIFLSGGLDSGSVAAVAAENSKRLGIEPPFAFSLYFRNSECDEETVQNEVARKLGLEQVGLGFDEALGGGGLLAPALEISSRLPAPLDNFWLPAYYSLGQQAKRRGYHRMLTGIGGDEWLSVSPTLAADLVLSFDLVGIYDLWRMVNASYKLPKLRMAWNLVWTHCARQILGEAGARALGRFAPNLLQAKRRAFRRIPDWFAEDPALRDEIEVTLEPSLTASEAGGFYMRDVRGALDHYLVSMEFEEDFEIAHRGGIQRLHPFLDADLLDLLARMPPRLLNRGGRAKGLVRGMMAARFPALGFESQRKIGATDFIESRLFAEAAGCWNAMGSRLALADLGVLDAGRWSLTLRDTLAQNKRDSLHFVWLVLTLESWLRARY